MRRLNAEHRGKRKATDILSFANLPFAEGQLQSPDILHGKDNHRDTVLSAMLCDSTDLGDLVVSAPFVDRYCHRHHLSMEEHWPVLLVHGVCHLLGFDHESDDQYRRMAQREDDLLSRWKERSPSAHAVRASLEGDTAFDRGVRSGTRTARHKQRYYWEWPPRAADTTVR